jgi:hypothetical protein
MQAWESSKRAPPARTHPPRTLRPHAHPRRTTPSRVDWPSLESRTGISRLGRRSEVPLGVWLGYRGMTGMACTGVARAGPLGVAGRQNPASQSEAAQNSRGVAGGGRPSPMIDGHRQGADIRGARRRGARRQGLAGAPGRPGRGAPESSAPGGGGAGRWSAPLERPCQPWRRRGARRARRPPAVRRIACGPPRRMRSAGATRPAGPGWHGGDSSSFEAGRGARTGRGRQGRVAAALAMALGVPDAS